MRSQRSPERLMLRRLPAPLGHVFATLSRRVAGWRFSPQPSRKPLSVWLLLLVAGCGRFLDVDPPGQVFRTIAFHDASADLGAEILGPSFGTGWGDINGDGWPDLWAGNHANVPSLYVNDQAGGFYEAVGEWIPAGVNLLYDAHGVAWTDLDGDGDQDLIESVGAQQGEGVGRNRVFLNQDRALIDEGTTRVIGRPSASGRCPVLADPNRDGRVDLLMVSQPHDDQTDANALFVQGADGMFTETAELPPDRQIPTALCGMLADIDGDDVAEMVSFGRPEHLQAYRGDAVTLEDVSREVGLPTAPMFPYDVVFADFDNDLDNDLFVTRWSEVSDTSVDAAAGYVGMALRVDGDAQGVRFRASGEVSISLNPPGFWTADKVRLGGDCSGRSLAPDDMRVTVTADEEDVSGLCPIVPGVDTGLYIGVEDGVYTVRLTSAVWNRGNVVVQADGPLTDVELLDIPTLSVEQERQFNRDRLFIREGGAYVDQGWTRGIQQLTTCTSAAAGDFDNDMDLDLFLVCARPSYNSADLLYVNDGEGRFTLLDASGAEGATRGRGDSVAMADYDQDGRLDLFVTNGYGALPFNQGPQTLLHNDAPLANHWLELDLVGTRSTPQGLGAKVIVRAGGVEQVREQTGGTHHMAQHAQRLHFGLGANTSVDEIEVRWPSGERSVFVPDAVDTVITVTEPGSR